MGLMASQRERRRNIRKLRTNYCICRGVWFIGALGNKHGAGRLLSLFPSYDRSCRLDQPWLWIEYMYRRPKRRSQKAYGSGNTKRFS